MKGKKRIMKTAACLLIPVVIAISVIAAGFFKTSPPDNPLLNQADTVDIDENNGSIFGLPQDFLSNIKQPEINTDSSKNSEDSSSSEQSSSESETEPDNNNVETNKNKTPNIYVTENIYVPNFPHSSDINSQKSQGNNLNSPVKSGDSGKTNSDISGNNPTPSGNKTNTEYFTTTIKNGETLSSRSYSFKIIHNQKNLKVKSSAITINGEKQADFNGRVFLSEGENHIRVEVTYTDKNSKVISAYREYKVFVDLGDIILTTDLKNQTVDNNTISFTAEAVLDGENVPVTVHCNKNVCTGNNGHYTAKLSENENIITLSARWNNKKSSKTYEIIYSPIKSFEIKTSLNNCTVNDSSFSFYAVTQNGSDKSRLSITFNGSALSINNSGNYSVKLTNGSNKIKLKATDFMKGEAVTITQVYTIKYVPIADEHTAPYIEYINVENGMTTKGNSFTLNILPFDYHGNPIYYDGITVRLNGKVIPYKWVSSYIGYDLYFAGGANDLDIRITDKDGRYSDYYYKINCITVADGEPLGEITISVDANVIGLDYLVKPTKITIRQGETASYTITKFLEEQGFACEYRGSLDDGFYLARISKHEIGVGAEIPQDLFYEIDKRGYEWKQQRYDDSIGEFDYCQGSGWACSINDNFIGSSLASANLKDGDTVKIRFTLANLTDINGTFGKTWW